jgi:hypothetical protein
MRAGMFIINSIINFGRKNPLLDGREIEQGGTLSTSHYPWRSAGHYCEATPAIIDAVSRTQQDDLRTDPRYGQGPDEYIRTGTDQAVSGYAASRRRSSGSVTTYRSIQSSMAVWASLASMTPNSWPRFLSATICQRGCVCLIGRRVMYLTGSRWRFPLAKSKNLRSYHPFTAIGLQRPRVAPAGGNAQPNKTAVSE